MLKNKCICGKEWSYIKRVDGEFIYSCCESFNCYNKLDIGFDKNIKIGYKSTFFNMNGQILRIFDKNGCWVTKNETDDEEIKLMFKQIENMSLKILEKGVEKVL